LNFIVKVISEGHWRGLACLPSPFWTAWDSVICLSSVFNRFAQQVGTGISNTKFGFWLGQPLAGQALV
jgi:hypothetical protein